MTPGLNLTPEQIETMERILAEHYKKNGTAKEFDLNKPPVPQYKHQEYPKVLYHHGERRAKKVHSDEERDKHLAEGWQLESFSADAPEAPELSAADQAEADAIDAELERRRRAKNAKNAKNAAE